MQWLQVNREPFSSKFSSNTIVAATWGVHHFYTSVLGFERVARPSSFTLPGVWLHGHGIGIHLILTEDVDKLLKKTPLDPRKNHVSFQWEDLEAAGQRLVKLGIDVVRQTIVEAGVVVHQIFFHEPDGYMVEICSYTNLWVVPI